MESLSIIIPCYKAVRYMDTLKENLLAVELPAPTELIFFADGCGESYGAIDAISNELVKKGYTVKHVLCEANAGIGHARNYCLKSAQGDWVIWWDCDDLVPVDSLTKRWSWRKKGEYHYGEYFVFEDTQGKCPSYREQLELPMREHILPNFEFEAHFEKNIMPLWSGIMHRDDAIYCNEALWAAEDYEYTLRLALTIPFVCHHEATVYYRVKDFEHISLSSDPLWQYYMAVVVYTFKYGLLNEMLVNEADLPDINGIKDFLTKSPYAKIVRAAQEGGWKPWLPIRHTGR